MLASAGSYLARPSRANVGPAAGIVAAKIYGTYLEFLNQHECLDRHIYRDIIILELDVSKHRSMVIS